MIIKRNWFLTATVWLVILLSHTKLFLRKLLRNMKQKEFKKQKRKEGEYFTT